MLNHTTSHFGRALIVALALATTGSVGFAADVQYYVNDPLATTVAIADSAGEIAAMEADAFGASLAIGEAPGRFTGKPYDADLGAYVFPFRNYRPEESRWMSADPSGFPDGVNGRYYSPMPLTEVDPLGLLKNFRPVSPNGFNARISEFTDEGVKHQVMYLDYLADTNDGSMTIPVWKALQPELPRWAYNCHGLVFAKGEYVVDPEQVSDAFIMAEGYRRVRKIEDATIASFGTSEHTGFVIEDHTRIRAKHDIVGMIEYRTPGQEVSAYGAVKYWE
jgi:RHS repeat-associated protein